MFTPTWSKSFQVVALSTVSRMKFLCLVGGVTVTTLPDMKYRPTVSNISRVETRQNITKYFFNWRESQEH